VNGIATLIPIITLALIQLLTAFYSARKMDSVRDDLAAKTVSAAKDLAAKTDEVALGLAAKTDEVALGLAAKTEHVAAELAQKAQVVADSTDEQLKTIHTLTNSNLTALKAELARTNAELERANEVTVAQEARIARLEHLLTRATGEVPPSAPSPTQQEESFPPLNNPKIVP